MAYEPQPFVAVNSGDAQDAPAGAKPISLYGVEAGGDAAPVAWDDVTDKPSTFAPIVGTTATTAKAGNYQPAWADVTGKPSTFAPATHTHAAADVTSGTLADARIPALAISKITGLQAKITELEGRLDALEAAAAG